jgi:eukaryotic-like serine/threonine-protein kinase
MDDEKTIISQRTFRVTQGTRLNGTYQIDSLIGAGGMSEIYRGHNIQTGDEVAIKIILPEFAKDEQMVALFRREALMLSRLSHQSIVRYHVFSHDPGSNLLYLAMEYIDGPTLRESMKQRPLSQQEASVLIAKVTAGMKVAHAEGIIHRDLSTDNILLVNNDVSRPKVIDFGIARNMETSDATLISSGFAGKYSFVSPEQLGLFNGEVGVQSDVYSLGLVFAAALLGRPLDMTGSHADVVAKRQSTPNLAMINPGVKPIIEAMLQPNPVLRVQSMDEVLALLQPLLPKDVEQTQRNARKPHGAVDKTASNRIVLAGAGEQRTSGFASRLLVPAILSILAFASWYGVTQTEPGRAALDGFLAKWNEAPEKPSVNPETGKSELKADGPTTTTTETETALVPDPEAPIPEPEIAKDPEQSESAKLAAPEVEKPADAVVPENALSGTEVPANETQDTQPQPEAPVEPEKQLAAAAVSPAQWVSSFQGGTCFFARSLEAGANSARIEGFGDSVAPFQDLEQRFQAAYGVEPSIGLRTVSKPQCPVVDFVKETTSGSKMAFFVQSDLLENNEPMRATLSYIDGENIGIFVVTPDGLMINVTGLAKRFKDEAVLEIPYSAFASAAGDAYLLFALASDKRVKNFERIRVEKQEPFFDALRKEGEGSLAATIMYIRKK